jgi:hypothetical protein
MNRSVLMLGLQLAAYWACAQPAYRNVQIDAQDPLSFYPPCEPSIAISQKNQAIMVAGTVLDNVYFSADSGATWSEDRLVSRYGVYGDPVIVNDPKKGTFFYLHLSNPAGKAWTDPSFLDRIVLQSSKDGVRWSKGTGIGHSQATDQDKHWAAHNGKRMVCTWTRFDKYGSKATGDSTNIMFSAARGRGKKWSPAVRINQVAGNCLDDDGTVEGAVPCFGPNGEIYVAWAVDEKIYFDVSRDGGKTWLDKDIVASSMPGGWEMEIPGIMRCNGMPITACDVSAGPHRGRVYICWADQRYGKDNPEVWIISSDDDGKTWTKPYAIPGDGMESDGTLKEVVQFFPWMTLDPVTGYLHVVYYDRGRSGGLLTDVVWAHSTDGGRSWAKQVISESPFAPDASVFFGDYNNISAVNNIIRPIWTRCEGGKLSVWTALINLSGAPAKP